MQSALWPNQRSGESPPSVHYTAFAGYHWIAAGDLVEVALRAKAAADRGGAEPILVFNDHTGELIELDLRGTPKEVRERLTRAASVQIAEQGNAPKRGPGRPKLGVIAREVTLLPGQWDWLDKQPDGASAALRRLVYEAKRQGKDQARRSQEAVYRVMTVLAGNLPGFEEALRSFYRRDHQRFESLTASWPQDIRAYLKRMVAASS